MIDQYRPRRSVLYMPAANARALEKAQTIAADGLIFDLEDAVAPDAKELAREQAAAAVAGGGYGKREVTIRCNGLDTPWGADDLRAAAQAGPDAIVIPKVSGPAHIAEIESHLELAGVPDHTMIWAMVETPEGILSVREIAAVERVATLVMGTNDMAKELRAKLVPGRAPLLTHLAQCVLAARAEDVVILDGVYNDIKNEDGFAAECQQGAEMGFDGKTLIHPAQVGPCNDAFSPSADEIEHAGRVIAAFEEAEREGRGVVTVDGRMIENLHVDNARRTLAVADAIAALAE
ncbi:MAG: CoA ester lyase [Acidimicrobiia bacterium]|jgi:citrate lyase subunit beta/citryl-CoA lyase|nr:CoA ester lyase [Acidimicrobiia bacterium]MBP8180725.1 CoA ester lyase [Acidimicrobiia bacterium]